MNLDLGPSSYGEEITAYQKPTHFSTKKITFCLYELGPFPSSFRKIESAWQKPTHFFQINWIFCQNELGPFPSSFRDWPVVSLML